ncbi:hypothetical protein RND81_06G116600 [Saponaria officinalis]|uniref:F-box domain-containing protein n=1 Tax=Saponaria officinalis TaxID=3572 RepID=A0AAW1K5I9_SAPOF
MAALLPTDIIADILSSLPPKPLCLFKTVSKFWNSLVNSQFFIKLHLTQTLKSNPNLVICHDSLSITEFSAEKLRFSAVDHPVKHLPDFPTVQLIGSCNGILCISDRFKKTVFFYNPCTKTRRLIPSAPSRIPGGENPLETHFNPSVYKQIDHIVAFGFGYDSDSDDYKLLRIIECYEERVQIFREVRVYSLRSNSWKNVNEKVYHHPHQQMDGVHINGVLYFARLVCADLWVMKENGKKESWVWLFWISDPSRIGSLTHIRPVVYSKDGGRILLELDSTKFGWFDWCSNKFESVKASGLSSNDSPFDTYTFVPSIVSLRTDEDRAKDKRKATGKVVPKKNITK